MLQHWKSFLGLAAIAALLCLIPLPAFAQDALTLEQAIEIALQNNPRLRMAQTDLKRIEATRGEVVELAPMEFSYSWGQLNGVERKDREYAVTQPVGSLLIPFYKNALVDKQVRTGTYYRQMVEKEVKAEVKRAWAYYLYAWNMRDMYKEQSSLADRLQKAGELRYKQGAISLLEKSMTTTAASSMHNKLFQAEEELKIAASRLQWVCYTDYPIVPDKTTVDIYPVDVRPHSLSEAHLNYFQSRAHEKKALLKIEKSRFFPELSFGYVQQVMLPERGLKSWMVGVSFPVWFVPQRSKVRQARYDWDMARIEADANVRELNNKVTELRANLLRYSESIRLYQERSLPEAESLIRAANAEFRESETDLIDYVQSLNAAREIKEGYIETVYQYNIAALEYELYHQ